LKRNAADGLFTKPSNLGLLENEMLVQRQLVGSHDFHRREGFVVLNKGRTEFAIMAGEGYEIIISKPKVPVAAQFPGCSPDGLRKSPYPPVFFA
jgi:hypothetical protein